MQRNEMADTVEKMQDAQEALSCLATQEALGNLAAAVDSLESLASSLTSNSPLAAPERAHWHESLLQFRRELQSANALTENGLAFCREMIAEGQATPSYKANGAAAPASSRGGVFLEG